MQTTYDVRIWNIKTRYSTKQSPRTGKRSVSSYGVRWAVDGKAFYQSYKNRAHAESFRSELVSSARKGEAFRTDDGLPVSAHRAISDTTWLQFAREYVDMKWPDSSAHHRRTTADCLVVISRAMLDTEQGLPNLKALNATLRRQFSKTGRQSVLSGEIASELTWLERHSQSVGSLGQPDNLRRVLARISVNQDGNRAAPNTIRLRRVTLHSALEYAVERKLLLRNPLHEVKIAKPRTSVRQVDKRAAPNPEQARQLLDAVRHLPHSGPRLMAFFGAMYFAGLRPEEAANLSKRHLALPAEGWGDLHLDRATPEVGGEWTNSGQRNEDKSLKHREDDEGRTVPCCPELTALLHQHMAEFGTAPDGRLFTAHRGNERVGSSLYGRIWARARVAVLGESEARASLLARTPYDLRHAAVSTWLAAGVPATKVAEWAGHSVAVLLRVYAKCLDGSEQTARDRVDRLLRDR